MIGAPSFFNFSFFNGEIGLVRAMQGFLFTLLAVVLYGTLQHSRASPLDSPPSNYQVGQKTSSQIID